MIEESKHQQNSRKLRGTLALVVFLAICLGAGGLGAVATTPEIDGWYRTLAKPRWNPPDWIFGPVWTTLFIMMAIAGWLVWRRGESRARLAALSLFGVQLTLNLGWSWIFFALHQPGWAAIEIVV
ncbi:MAG: tryptophan-rich sensory protein, partial [Rhodopirellula sp.]|nr:tryptophan-rich sensory protein [Rhodopirellula sp.]